MLNVPDIKMSKWKYFRWNRDDPVGLRTHIFETYGDIAKFDTGKITNYFFTHPDYAQIILGDKQDDFFNKHPALVHGLEPLAGLVSFFTQNDPVKWKRDREVALKSVNVHVFFERYMAKFYEIATKRVDAWFDKYPDNAVVDVGYELTCLIINFVNNSFFYYIEDSPEETVDMMYHSVGTLMAHHTTYFPWIWKLPWKKKQYDEAIGSNREAYKKWVRRRLESGDKIDDFIGNAINEYGNELSREELIDQIGFQISTASGVGLFTTSPALFYVLIALTRHPEIRQKICREISDVLGDEQPTYEQINKLTYTIATIKESMRMNSTSFNQLRQAVVDTSVKGYFIPKGAGVIINNHQIHHHPDFWKEPNTFNPQRFLDNPFGQSHPYAYLPFGSGKRGCIGRNFAFLEILTALVIILRRFSFEFLPNQEVKPVMSTAVTIRPSINNLKLKQKTSMS